MNGRVWAWTFSAGLLISVPASATTFDDAGAVSVAAERLFGLSHSWYDTPGESRTGFSLLGGSGLELMYAMFSIPRVGVDYFVVPHVSLGLSGQLARVSLDDDEWTTMFTLNPRIGSVFGLGPQAALWPRAGISYLHMGFSNSGNSDTYVLDATVEAQLVILPVEHVGILIGPALDLGLSGSRDHKASQAALHAGLLVWF